MSRDDIRDALLLLEEPAEASPEFRQALLQRFISEASAPEGAPSPEEPAPSRLRRLRWLRLRPIPAVAAGLVIALLGTVLVIFPRSPSAWAALERAREQFRPRSLHATISNDTQAFGPDLETVREIRVVEIWFESETRWREETLSYNLFPEEDGNFTVFEGKLFGRYQSQVSTLFVQPASEIEDPYGLSGLVPHDPTMGAWGTSTGIKPTQQFLDENCEVSEDQIAGRAADKLTCKTGLEGDTLREATIWLDRETGLILKLDTFSCGTVEGKRRCGHEAVREVTSIEFDASFPDGIFDVIAPEGATVRWAGSGPAPAEYQTAPGKEVAATFPLDVPAGGGGVEMAFGFGSLWVLTQESYREGELRRIDPLTGKVLATIPIDGDFGDFTIEPTPPAELSQEERERIRRGEAPPPDEHPPTFRVQGLAVGEGFVWVGKVAGGRGEEHVAALERIDAKTNKVVGSPIRAGDRIDQIGDLTVAAGAVWMTGVGKSLAKVDAKSLAVTHIELEGETLWALGEGNGPVLGDGSLWVPVLVPNPRDPRDDRFLVRLDPATNAVQAKTSRDIGLGLSDLVFAEGALWFLGGDGRTTWVRRLDPRTNRVVASVAERPAGVDFPRYNALAGGGGYLWASDAIDNTVLKIDPRTNELVASIGVGRVPGQIAVGSRSIWVLNVEDRTVSRIDF